MLLVHFPRRGLSSLAWLALLHFSSALPVVCTCSVLFSLLRASQLSTPGEAWEDTGLNMFAGVHVGMFVEGGVSWLHVRAAHR